MKQCAIHECHTLTSAYALPISIQGEPETVFFCRRHENRLKEPRIRIDIRDGAMTMSKDPIRTAPKKETTRGRRQRSKVRSRSN